MRYGLHNACDTVRRNHKHNIMKTSHLLPFIAIPFLFASCTKEEVEEVKADEGKDIAEAVENAAAAAEEAAENVQEAAEDAANRAINEVEEAAEAVEESLNTPAPTPPEAPGAPEEP